MQKLSRFADMDLSGIEFESSVVTEGGPGSGNRGHAGRPGERGGSAPGGSASSPGLGVRTSSPHIDKVASELLKRPDLTSREVAITLDRNGNKLSVVEGEAQRVQFSFEEVAKLKDAEVSIHNHPLPISFSNGDMVFAAAYNIKKAVVVLSNGEVHELEPESGKWPDWHALSEYCNKVLERFEPEYADSVSKVYKTKGASTKAEDDEVLRLKQQFVENLNTAVAEHFNLRYTRHRPNKPKPVEEGSATSGNYGHSGRPGERGGSAPGKGSGAGVPDHVTKRIKGIESTSHAVEVRKRFNSDDYKSERVPYCATYEMTDEQYIAATEETLKKVLSEASVRIRVTEASLRKILMSGRFKNQFETNTSGGYLGHDERKRIEQAMAYEEGTPGYERPIYGYIIRQEPKRDYSLEQYGSISVVLNDDVRDRTTFTDHDSLDLNLHIPRSYPSPITKPSVYSLYGNSNGSDILDEARGGPESASYWEAQIHGGVHVKDIKVVFFKEEPSSMMKSLLQEKEIKWKIKE